MCFSLFADGTNFVNWPFADPFPFFESGCVFVFIQVVVVLLLPFKFVSDFRTGCENIAARIRLDSAS